ncbi:aldo/keto reductase [Elusimicrobiota bacterium]
MEQTRREFLKLIAASALLARTHNLFAIKDTASMPHRQLGKTGWKTSLLGFGGGSISHMDRKKASKVVTYAIEQGINYIDTASTYGHHSSEAAIGAALTPKLRTRIFLTTKILKRTRKTSTQEFEESLRNLKTEPDLVQIHSVNSMSSLQSALSKNGSIKTAQWAKKKGYARFIGITGHTDPEVISKALDMYPFDTVLIPLGAADHHISSFEPVIEKANKKKIAVINMKLLAAGAEPRHLTLDELLHYGFSLPVSTAIVGFKSTSEIDQAVESVKKFKPLKKEQVDAILKKSKKVADSGVMWWK